MVNFASAVPVEFPLRGEWIAVNTPARRVPSHGTNYFGQRYAFDFTRMLPGGHTLYERGMLRHFLATLPAREFLAWDQPVHATFAGRVIAIGDGWPDRERVNAFRELLRPKLSTPRIAGEDYRPLAGNYVMVEGDPGVGFYAHLRCGSVSVRSGDRVASGQILGNVGNSGNSTNPHLHFHVMSDADPLKASGVLCCFREYERLQKDTWLPVTNGVPAFLERIRVER